MTVDLLTAYIKKCINIMNFETIQTIKKIFETYNITKSFNIVQMFRLLVFISLLAINSYGVIAITLDANLLTQLGYNNQSLLVYANGYNITDIDPDAFKGYNQLTILRLQSDGLSKVDLSLFKDLVKLEILDLNNNPSMTELTNSKKIIFPFIAHLYCDNSKLTSLDSNVINGLPNLLTFFVQNGQFSPLKPNQLSAWKKLQNLGLLTKNQTSLTKECFNGLNSLVYLSFMNSGIKTVEVHTFVQLTNLTYISLSGNDITAFEYLQIPNKLDTLNLQGNKMNYFMLSRTMGVIKTLYINNNLFRSFKSMDFTFLANLTYLDLSNNPHAYPNEIAGHMKPLVNLNCIRLNNLSISSIDSNFFKQNTKLQYIELASNKISVLPYNTFSYLKNLSSIVLSGNQISVLDNRTFIGLNNLDTIYLVNNKLTRFDPITFNNLSKLTDLSLYYNLISEIDSSAFRGCYKLAFLDIANNRLTKISPGTFKNLSLDYLRMNLNQISEIDDSTFEGISRLNILELTSNTISKIGPGTFNKVNITSLYLSNNLLTKIENDTFAGQTQLSNLYLKSNKIATIEEGAFNGLINLQNIYLEYNNLTQLDSSIFSGCSKLQGIYLYYNPNLNRTNLQSLCPTDALRCKVYI